MLLMLMDVQPTRYVIDANTGIANFPFSCSSTVYISCTMKNRKLRQKTCNFKLCTYPFVTAVSTSLHNYIPTQNTNTAI